MRLDIGELPAKAIPFKQRLDRAKAAHRGFEWYPYNSLSNLAHLDRLLTGPQRDLARIIGEGTVLDLGCADGDLSFFFESLGANVHAVDHPTTNHNGMRGVRALKAALQSNVEIFTIDIDRQFTLPQARYGLAIFLGAIYHLKNPFYALETLARHCTYAVMSTRVARLLPDRTTAISDSPIAYLVGEDELNADDSNYWIFSDKGLRRLLQRTRWQVVDWISIGDTAGSDPVNPEHDERVFCLARSCYGMRHLDLTSGWHEPEEGGWRWSERRFSAAVRSDSSVRGATLRFFLPAAVLQRGGSVRLLARVNGIDLEPATFREEGLHLYECGFPRETSTAESLTIEFELSDALPPDASDGRERGVIVASLDVH